MHQSFVTSAQMQRPTKKAESLFATIAGTHFISWGMRLSLEDL